MSSSTDNVFIRRTAEYSDPSAAHERALRLKLQGAKNILVTPCFIDSHIVSWDELPGRPS